MGLVDKENGISLLARRKESLQIDVRIEEVIVITDHRIGKKAYIQCKFKGADPESAGVFLDGLAAVINSLRKDRIERIVDPVKMPLSVRTGLGITGALLHEAYLVLGREHYALKMQTVCPKQLYRIPGYSPGDRLGRQVE